mmetsp:Transcript_64418/g.134422  ORF Transcript_64418/g.134422 Transcript_64418/m.134422 type:complete len:125 (-) Transcript_64418:355-729(-)
MGTACRNRQLQTRAWEKHHDSLSVKYVEGKGYCLFAGRRYKEGECIVPYFGEMYLEDSLLDKERSNDYKFSFPVTRINRVTRTNMVTDSAGVKQMETLTKCVPSTTVYQVKLGSRPVSSGQMQS